MSAILAYDAQIAASGVTTVFDSLRIGAASRASAVQLCRGNCHDVDEAKALTCYGCDHLTHLRADRDSRCRRRFHALPGAPKSASDSLMDHTPGQGSFAISKKCASIRDVPAMSTTPV